MRHAHLALDFTGGTLVPTHSDSGAERRVAVQLNARIHYFFFLKMPVNL